MGKTGSVSKQRNINVKLFKHGHAFFTHSVYGKVEIIDINRDMAVVALNKDEQIEIDIGLLKPVISTSSRNHSKGKTADKDGLNVLCRLCEKKCADKDRQHHEVKPKLFSDCIKIMLDDTGVFFEYLRLKSPAGQTICSIRSFFHYAITNRILFIYHDRKMNTNEIIPPISVINCLKEAIIRWGFKIPLDFNFEPLEMLLTRSKNLNTDPSNPRRNIVTKCPQCGDPLKIALNDIDIEQLSKGSRYIHKIVEHGKEDNIHGVNIFIDSEYRVRRKSAVQIVKSIICP